VLYLLSEVQSTPQMGKASDENMSVNIKHRQHLKVRDLYC
jgi:hypothetical protein